jgi:drug/metabolite transporter (DMT)-like permease
VSRTTSAILLFIGLLLVSTAGPFLVSAHMDAFAVAFWRLVATSSAFLVWGLATGQLAFTREHLKRTALGGILLGMHLGLWIWAFDLTDFASNLLLLVVQPVMAAVAGARLGERTTRATWIAVAIALVGLSIIAGGDISLGPRALFGDAVSIVSNISMTLFYASTREARRSTPLPAFMAVSMGSGALALLPVVIATHSRLVGYPDTSWRWLAALVLVTTVGGHGVMNFVARHVTLFTLNVVIVLEPALGIALGVPLFGATITPIQIVGGAVLSAAVVVGLLPEWSRHSDAKVAEIDGF